MTFWLLCMRKSHNLIARRIIFWLSYSKLCKLWFDILLIALKGITRLNRWYPVGINLKRMWFFVLSVEAMQIVQVLARVVA